MKRRLTIAILSIGMVASLGVVVAPHVLPTALAWLRPDIWFVAPTKERQVFVTIDDAPSSSTPEILAVLKRHGVPATFFIVSDRVKAGAQLEEIVEARHALGHHMQSTQACSKLSSSEFRSAFDACEAVLERYGNARHFRPASDFGTCEQIAYARSKGYQAIIGTVFPMDHWISDPDWLVRIARWLAIPGGVLILHDGSQSGRTTAAVLDRLIPQLKAAGYSFGRLGKEPNKAPEPTPGSVTPRAADPKSK